MLKKSLLTISMSFCLITSVFAANTTNATAPVQTQSPVGDHTSATEKDRIMKIDEVDSTDTYAIPFDDSEVEDRETINRGDRKEVFNLPQSR